jgi:hypothetical protein
LAAKFPATLCQCKFAMQAYSGEKPRGGIAKTLATVFAPAASAVAPVLFRQLLLAPFGGPAKLSAGAAPHFSCEDFARTNSASHCRPEAPANKTQGRVHRVQPCRYVRVGARRALSSSAPPGPLPRPCRSLESQSGLEGIGLSPPASWGCRGFQGYTAPRNAHLEDPCSSASKRASSTLGDGNSLRDSIACSRTVAALSDAMTSNRTFSASGSPRYAARAQAKRERAVMGRRLSSRQRLGQGGPILCRDT